MRGRTWTLDQMETEYGDRWNFGEKARVTVQKAGGLAPGRHRIELGVREVQDAADDHESEHPSRDGDGAGHGSRTKPIFSYIAASVGAMADGDMQRYWRDARLMTITEGTSEVQHIIIARELGLDIPEQAAPFLDLGRRLAAPGEPCRGVRHHRPSRRRRYGRRRGRRVRSTVGP